MEHWKLLHTEQIFGYGLRSQVFCHVIFFGHVCTSPVVASSASLSGRSTSNMTWRPSLARTGMRTSAFHAEEMLD